MNVNFIIKTSKLYVVLIYKDKIMCWTKYIINIIIFDDKANRIFSKFADCTYSHLVSLQSPNFNLIQHVFTKIVNKKTSYYNEDLVIQGTKHREANSHINNEQQLI